LDLIERLLQDALQSLPPYIPASIRTQLETTPAHLRADIELMNAVLNVYLFFVIIMVVSAVLEIYTYWKRNSFVGKIVEKTKVDAVEHTTRLILNFLFYSEIAMLLQPSFSSSFDY